MIKYTAVERKILLNPGPATTTDSVKLAQVVPDICPREKDFCLLMQSVREKLLRVVSGAPTHEIILIPGSGTAALEACLSSVLLESKKILVINNGTYGQLMLEICRAYYTTEQIIELKFSDEKLPNLNDIQEKFDQDENIAYLAVVHHETTNGLLNPLENIYQICRSSNVGTIVDAMSSFAGRPIDLSETPYDFLISSSNKCIQGMPGIGFVICNREKLTGLKNTQNKNYYLNLYGQYESIKNTGQMRFTPPVQIIYALDKALDELFLEGKENRFGRYQKSWRCLLDGLKRLNLKPLLPEALHSKILTAIKEPNISGFNYQAMHDFLYDKGITLYPGKGGNTPNFRVANMGDIDEKDINTFLSFLGEYLESLSR